MTLEWDYNNQTVIISMLGYIDKTLLEFQYFKNKESKGPVPYTPP